MFECGMYVCTYIHTDGAVLPAVLQCCVGSVATAAMLKCRVSFTLSARRQTRRRVDSLSIMPCQSVMPILSGSRADGVLDADESSKKFPSRLWRVSR